MVRQTRAFKGGCDSLLWRREGSWLVDLFYTEACYEEDVKKTSSQRNGRAREDALKVKCFPL